MFEVCGPLCCSRLWILGSEMSACNLVTVLNLTPESWSRSAADPELRFLLVCFSHGGKFGVCFAGERTENPQDLLQEVQEAPASQSDPV